MNDTPQPATPNPTAAGAKQNPLDVLEEILKDAQQKGSPAGGAPSNQQPTVSPEVEQEQKMAVLAQQDEERKIVEAQELQVQIQNLQTITQTPEYQARLAQEQQQQQADQKHQQDISGHEIRQLKHKKI